MVAAHISAWRLQYFSSGKAEGGKLSRNSRAEGGWEGGRVGCGTASARTIVSTVLARLDPCASKALADVGRRRRVGGRRSPFAAVCWLYGTISPYEDMFQRTQPKMAQAVYCKLNVVYFHENELL